MIEKFILILIVFSISIMLNPVLIGNENECIACQESNHKPNSGFVFLNDVDDPVCIEDILMHIKAYDMFGKNISNNIFLIEDNYTDNNNIIGDFIVVLGVKDCEGLKETIIITIRNIDVNPPKITIKEESLLNVKIHEDITKYDFSIKAYDEYDGDLSSNITYEHEIDTDHPGEYVLIATVFDSSGNKVQEKFTVSVYRPSYYPFIEGPSNIVKNAGFNMSKDFFLDFFTGVDKNERDITERIKVVKNDYLKTDGGGTYYEIILSLTDSGGVSTKHNVTLSIRHDIKPKIILDNKHFIVANSYYFKEDEIIKTLNLLLDLPEKSTFFENQSNYDSENFDIPGIYIKEFIVTDDLGPEEMFTLYLEVVEDETLHSNKIFDEIMGRISLVFNHYWWIISVASVVLGTVLLRTIRKKN